MKEKIDARNYWGRSFDISPGYVYGNEWRIKSISVGWREL